MLRQKALVEVLGQANTCEVTGTLLFNKEGVLLAYSGYADTKTSANVSAALISSIWESFDKKASGREEMKEAIILCEDGMIAAARVSNMLLAVKATKNANIGLVRHKLRALAKHLDGPITIVSKNG